MITPPIIGRRVALASAAALAWSCARARPRVVSTRTPSCILTPEQVEGPYYLDDARVRRDLREGEAGIPLAIALEVIDVRTCRPLAGAAVDLWHCNAVGLYSGFTAERVRPMPSGARPPFGSYPGGPPFGDGRGPPPRPRRSDALSFLRGTQLTDVSGRVEFDSVYPGWYPGRAVHVHARVRTGGAVRGQTYGGGHVAHTGQLYFPEAESDQIFALPPYGTHAGQRMLQRDDFIFENGGAAGLVDLARLDRASLVTGYRATVTMMVDPLATPPSTR